MSPAKPTRIAALARAFFLLVAILAPVPLQAAIFYVDPVQGSDVWDGQARTFNGRSGPWRTLDKANLTLRPGDTVYLGAGTYGVTLEPAASGSPTGGFVTYAASPGEKAVAIREANLEDRSYIRIQGLEFASPTGLAWLISNANTHHIELLDNRFNSEAPVYDAFGGINISGQYWTLRGNSFGRWLGNMVHCTSASFLLFEANDFSQARGQHALIAAIASNVVIRGNYFRNPWGRAIHITWNGSTQSSNILIDNNLFIDSDWDGAYPTTGITGQQPGASEVVRLLASRAVFRNNLLIGNHQGWDWNCYGTLSFQTYTNPKQTSQRYEKTRVYHNTFHSNRRNAIIFLKNTKTLYATNNKFKNNVLSDSENYAVAFPQAGIPWTTYLFESNLIGSKTSNQPIFFTDAGGPHSVATIQTAVGRTFKNNIAGSPRFVGPDMLASALRDPASFTLPTIHSFFSAYRLASTSPGAKAGTPLALTSAAGFNTKQITLDDAIYFSDGMGLVQGDRILVGRNEPVTITKILDDRTIQIDTAITFGSGDRVFLEWMGTTPDVGVR